MKHDVAIATNKVEPPVGVTPSRVLVRFVLPAHGARHVKLAGDFNGWRTDDIELSDEKGDGVFTATVPLPAGHHSYLFNVDGNWVQDPAATSIPDGFGQQNSVLDFVLDEARRLDRRLAADDRAKLEEYLSNVREVERRIENFLTPKNEPTPRQNLARFLTS